MKEYDITSESAFHNYDLGYEEGYKHGKKDAVVHAKWVIKDEPPEYHYMTIVCSHCKEEFVIEANNDPLMKYCCECGAKMDEEEKQNETNES